MKTNQKIKSLSEAFSMQPMSYTVGEKLNRYYSTKPGPVLARIEAEVKNYPVAGDPFECYYFVGYDDEGNVLFEFRRESMNVFYY